MEKLLNDINELLKQDISKVLRGMLICLKEELEIEIFSKKNGEEYRKKAIQLSKTIKNVQLGCGKHLLNNYINIDIKNADIIWDIRYSLPFEDSSIKRIFSEHVLEHMDYPNAANKFVEESYRVLEDDGEFIVGIPDIDLPINDIVNKTDYMKLAKEKWYQKRSDVLDNMDNAVDYLNYVMRDQLFHEEFHPHYWGYNEENLTKLLKKHGFKEVKKWNPDVDIVNPKRIWGTLYLIAKK